MHNLSLHCQNKEYNPIAEYRPEDRNIEYGKEGHDKCNAMQKAFVMAYLKED
jgi:hypothetical protein